jgi:hypothetical protein
MGSVYEQTKNEGLGNMEWYHISLSEINTIRSLIRNRIEFDRLYWAKTHTTNDIFLTNGTDDFIENIIVSYIDLENLIHKANLNKTQLHIIKKLMQGYTEEDLAELYKWDLYEIQKSFAHACIAIKKQNDMDWIAWSETSGKVKIPDETRYKRCNKCGRDLRANTNNFSPHSKGLYKLHPYCRDCRR